MTSQYQAGVKEYRATYWEPDYRPKDTDLLAVFKAVPQAGVPREEVAAAVAAESSTGTWTTVWTDLLTDLDHYRGRAYRIEDVPGDPEAFYAYVAYPLDLFEEGSVVNVLTSLVGNVFGFKALRSLRLEDIRFPLHYVMTCGGPPNGIVVERDNSTSTDEPCSAARSSPSSACRPRTTAGQCTRRCAAASTSPRTTRTSTASPSCGGGTASTTLPRRCTRPKPRPASARATT